MNVQGVQRERHVVLVVDACSDVHPLVDLAVDLVTEMTADDETHLRGLFVEDEDLLSVADLPCSREIAQHSAQQRDTSRERTLASLRQQARRFHQYLQQEAKASQISWSSDNRSGRISAPGDFIESGACCHIFARPTARHVRSGEIRTHRILLLESHSPFMLQALQVAIKQMPTHRIEVMLIARPDLAGDDPSMLPLVQSWQKDFPLMNVREYPRQYLGEVLKHHPPCDYVILSGQETEETQHVIHASLGCPVLLVS